MEYPEEIYQVFSDDMSGSGRRHAYEVGHNIGYLKGLAERPDPLTGYSNLTVAIKDNEPIDWEKLDGLKVQCVQPGSGALSGKLVRDDSWLANSGSGWKVHGMGADYITVTAWYGEDGWSLWVEGDIPLVRKTADQLEVGHLFTGRTLNGTPGEYLLCTADGGEETLVLWASNFAWTKLQAKFWEVITDHGPLQKPEDK